MGKPEYYTVKEAAARLRVSKMTIYRMVDWGELPGAIRIGRTIRITAVPFDLWLRELAEQSTPESASA
jgi:excisionase family DNA binding protein